jgi:hypothetical protein
VKAALGIAVEGTGLAAVPSGTRRGYHVSTVILPWYNVTPRGRLALATFARRNPDQPVVWHHRPGYSWWETAASQERKDKLMRMVAKRSRGVRSTYRQLAGFLGVSVTSLTRTVRGLARAGVVLVTTTRGRRGRTVIRMFHPKNKDGVSNTPSPSSTSMGGTNRIETPVAPAPAPLEGEFWERLRAQAEARRAEINRETPW